MKSVYTFYKVDETKNCVKYQIGECVEGEPVLMEKAHLSAYLLKDKIGGNAAAPDQVTITIEY